MVRPGPIDQADRVIADLLNTVTAFVDRLSSFDEWAVLLSTYLSTAVEMTFLVGLLVPGESVVMLAGSLPDGPAGVALAVAAGTAGGLTGQILGYAVGRVFGSRLRHTRLGRRIGAERFDRAEAYLRERGAPALVAVRFVAVIHAVVPIAAGVARMPFGRFLLWSALGTTLWVGAFTGLGVVTADADSTGGIGLVLTAIGATCIGVLPLGARLIRRAVLGTAPAPAAETAATAGAFRGAAPAATDLRYRLARPSATSTGDPDQCAARSLEGDPHDRVRQRTRLDARRGDRRARGLRQPRRAPGEGQEARSRRGVQQGSAAGRPGRRRAGPPAVRHPSQRLTGSGQ
jgi:membrane-associated protein